MEAFSLLICAIFHLLPVLAGGQRKLINIDYLGIGYDAIQGNPHSDLEDPGFKQSVFPLEYSKEIVTADGRFQIPDNTEAYQMMNCGYQTDSEEVQDERSYRKSLSVDAKLEGSVFFVPFSASAEYNKVHSETYMNRKKYVSTAARCNVYKANIKLLSMNRLSADFTSAVQSLPLDDYGPYLHLISVYGTHYVSSVIMGAKAMVRSEFEHTVWNTLKRQNFDLDVAAEASFWIVNLKLDVDVKTVNDKSTKFNSERSSFKSMYIGSRPPSDGNWESWMNASGRSPYPIRYTLRPLTELLDHVYFPNADKSTISQKRTRLNAAVSAWSRCQPDCRIPVNMKLPILADQVKADVRGVKVLSCSPGTVLLSCGLDNVDITSSWDPNRYAVPINSTSCKCSSSRHQVHCVLWCTNAVQQFQIATARKPTSNNTFKAVCPSGTQVLGCQSKRLSATSSSSHHQRDQWPTDNGTACLCYDTRNAECTATCAAGIREFNIRSSVGRGYVTASCPQNTVALGCGSWAQTTGQSRRRGAVVAMRTACRCYDDYDVTCYAMCGVFASASSYADDLAAASMMVSNKGSEYPTKTILIFAVLVNAGRYL